jgi:hypothetical protein
MAEKRRSKRFSNVAPEQRPVRVHLGKQVTDAELLELSAGGMLIRLGGELPGVDVNAIVDVESPAGRIQGRVAHMGSDGSGIRLGIQRLAELVRSGSTWGPPPWIPGVQPPQAVSRALFWSCLVAIVLGAIAGAVLMSLL